MTRFCLCPCTKTNNLILAPWIYINAIISNKPTKFSFLNVPTHTAMQMQCWRCYLLVDRIFLEYSDIFVQEKAAIYSLRQYIYFPVKLANQNTYRAFQLKTVKYQLLN